MPSGCQDGRQCYRPARFLPKEYLASHLLPLLLLSLLPAKIRMSVSSRQFVLYVNPAALNC